MKNEPYIQHNYDALQVSTLVILEARLVTRDDLRGITEYKVVINCPRAVFATTSMCNFILTLF